jgi:hypothetical protein
MRSRPRKLKTTLSLLLAMSIALSGLGELALASRCADAPIDAASCSATECCCSRGSDAPRACCCCLKKTPAPQAPSSDANKSHSDLKLAPWAQPAFAAAPAPGDDQSRSPFGSHYSSPLRPSVLPLLCTWRI